VNTIINLLERGKFERLSEFEGFYSVGVGADKSATSLMMMMMMMVIFWGYLTTLLL
jgi:hypothetical protein